MCGILTISGKKRIIDFWSIKFIRVREGLKKTKLGYHLFLCYPSDMVEAAVEMDRILLSMVQKATGLAIPMVEQGIGVEHCP